VGVKYMDIKKSQKRFEEARKIFFYDDFKKSLNYFNSLIISVSKEDETEENADLNSIKHKSLYYAGRCYNHLNLFEEAINSLNRAFKLSKGRLLYTIPLAYAHKKNGNTQESFKLWEKIFTSTEDKNDKLEHFFRAKGAAYIQNDNYNQAIPEYKKSIQECKNNQNPDSDTAICLFLSYHMKGRCHQHLKEYDESIRSYEQALVYYPDDITSIYRIGYIQSKYLQNYEKSIENLSNVIETIHLSNEGLQFI
jgi:tetratricopeptide (TPR) repeat protein